MKIVLVLLAVLAVFAFSGCSKSKTSNCKVTQNVPYVGPSVTNTTTTIDKGSCGDLNTTSTTTVDGMTVTTTMECTEQ